MKEACFISLCLLAVAGELFSQERNACIGIGMYGLADGSVIIHSGYAFAGHWSLASDISFSYGWLKRVKSVTESVHDSEFPDNRTGIPEPEDFMSEHLSFRYWPQKAHAGPYISTGIMYGSRTGLDYTLGIGYGMSIWKGLQVTAGWASRLKRIMNDNAISMELSINYLF